jgi:hypothetical protein
MFSLIRCEFGTVKELLAVSKGSIDHRRQDVATTQNHYLKTASPDAIAAVRQFSEAYCAPGEEVDSAKFWLYPHKAA